MEPVHSLPYSSWDPIVSPAQSCEIVESLERGSVIYLPKLPFDLDVAERSLISPGWLEGTRNSIYLSGNRRTLHGTHATGKQHSELRNMIERFGLRATRLVLTLIPEYRGQLISASTSFRPREAANQTRSWRDDDSRLHTDASSTRPLRGRRILRVFTNANPQGNARLWRIGEPFAQMAERFLPKVSRPLPGKHWMLKTLGVTKSPRSEYDHIMLRLHDLQKRDLQYQKSAPQTWFAFPPGSTWICFTDQVPHAVMSGQFLFEQTFHLPVESQHHSDAAPLRVLESMIGRRLAA